VVRNDTSAVLRAGTDSEVGVGLVCGAGVNCVGVGPGGRRVGFPALGDISGDWGGGRTIGLAALAAAVRAQDGRGGPTLLRDLVPRHFGFAQPSSLVRALYVGRLDEDRLLELPPVVFAAAEQGDPIAASIVDQQADELVVMAAAILRRLRMTRAAVDVVLGGGILASGYPRLIDRIGDGLAEVAPRARLVRLCTAPVAGAALLGLDELGVAPSVDVRRAVDEAIRRQESR
jgi:N-acetylglucosamine kinase-like BadF-type ATPase